MLARSLRKRFFSIQTKYANEYLLELSDIFTECKGDSENIKKIIKLDDKLTVDIETSQFGKGSYVFTKTSSGDLTLITPLSVGHTYKFNEESKWWESTSDKHNMVEFIVRDWLRLGCKGMPQL